MSLTILIATRKSPLALKQTELVQRWLSQKNPDKLFHDLPLVTKVDERLNWSLEKRGEIGLFTKELETALLNKTADLAVHSAKDMPTTETIGLSIAGYLPRARANDVLVCRDNIKIPKYIATSSPRRRAQMSLINKDIQWTQLRGNVGSRLRKIASSQKGTNNIIDATVLAAAGLERLNIKNYEGLRFIEQPIETFVPAPGQAAIAIQCRDEDIHKYTDQFCSKTYLAVSLERQFLRRLGGGCQTPIGAYYDGEKLFIYHPETGHITYNEVINDCQQIDTYLTKLMLELKL
ncbi:MAG: hydroxymethylbilane synthase [Verrucomicrobiota bacterium]|nr:hydroxymethylbilane synthase [Verrucomicrobiota bacterium]